MQVPRLIERLLVKVTGLAAPVGHTWDLGVIIEVRLETAHSPGALQETHLGTTYVNGVTQIELQSDLGLQQQQVQAHGLKIHTC